MIIGIDSSRAFVSDKTGTENYSFNLINTILRLPESKSHTFVLFIRPNANVPSALALYTNVIVKSVNFKYLWTQVGLAWETYQNPKIDVLWIPAHTLPALRNPKIKTVVTIHGLEYQWLPEYKNLLQRWYLPLSTFYAAKAADKIIAVSKFTANQLIEQLHTSNKKIKVVHEGAAYSSKPVSESSSSTLQMYGIQDKKYILFVGSVQPRKNLASLIKAFSHFATGIAGDTVSDYKLVIAGGIGWMAEEVLKSPSLLGIQDRVVFCGRVNDDVLRDLYKGASLYVQPSITEGFGLPVIEAMLNKVPVVSSDGGALSEVVGKAGVIVPLNDNFVVMLATAIKRVLSDKKLQKSLIAMGSARAKEFTWEKAARETLKIITG